MNKIFSLSINYHIKTKIYSKKAKIKIEKPYSTIKSYEVDKKVIRDNDERRKCETHVISLVYCLNQQYNNSNKSRIIKLFNES